MSAHIAASAAESAYALPFDALIDMAEANAQREFLTSNTDLMPFYGLAMMDRSKMLSFLQSVYADNGEEEVHLVIQAVERVRGGFSEFARRAEAVLARTIIVTHDVLGIDPQSTESDAAIAWRQALADLHANPPAPEGAADADGMDARHCAAADALIGTPAVDRADFTLKLRLAVERADGFGFPEEYATALIADAERLEQVA